MSLPKLMTGKYYKLAYLNLNVNLKYFYNNMVDYLCIVPVPVATWSKVWGCSRLLGLWVRIQPEAWMSVLSVVCCQVEVLASG